MATLVIAFDGLDKELIEEFDLKNIPQQEFGRIDNSTDIKFRNTSELFASFITGETFEKHGVKSLKKWSNPRIDSFENKVEGNWFFDKFKGIRQAIFESINGLNARKTKYRREDLKCDTFFGKLDDSRAMFVPAYNPSIFWSIEAGIEPLAHSYTLEETAEHWDSREHNYRRNEVFEELGNQFIEPRSLLMCHFHRPDIYHHLYGDERIGTFNNEKLREMYEEVNLLAEEIKNKAEESGYDRIIFMSDHGLPEEKQHNKNAFYSCNKELFGSQEPHITDFHDKILGLETE